MTDAKAKELRRIAERMITLGKRGTLRTLAGGFMLNAYRSQTLR
jgi:ribosomal protein L17